MADARLQVLIEALDKYSSEFKKAQGSFDDLARRARTAGLVVSGFGAVGVLALRSFAGAALEQQRAMRSLAAVTENSGVAFDSVRGKVEAVTAALARKTAVGDEAQMRVLGLMVPILGDVDKALAALPAVLDLSATSGRDLAMTARTLSSALAGNMDSSSQLGLKFEETAGFGERLQQVLGRVQGAAEANADPFAKLSDSMGELKEKMGDAVLPLVKPFIEFLTNAANKAQELDPRLFRVAAGMWTTATALASLAGPALLAVSYLPKIVAGFQMLAAVQWATIAGGIASVGVTAASIAAPFVVAAAGAFAFGAAFRTLSDILAGKFLDVEGEVQKWTAAWNTFTEDIKGQIQSIADGVTGLLPTFDAMTDKLMKTTGGARVLADGFDKLTGAAQDAISAQIALSIALGETEARMSSSVDAETRAVQARLDLLHVSELLGTSFEDLQQAIKAHVEAGLVPAVAWEVELALQAGRVNASLESLAATVVGGTALLAAMREQGVSLVEMFNRLSQASKLTFEIPALTSFDETRAALEAMGRSVDPLLEQYRALLDAGWESERAWKVVAVTLRDSVNKELDTLAEKLEGGREKLSAMREAGASWVQMFAELAKLPAKVAEEIDKVTEAIDRMMAKLDQAVRAQQRAPIERLEAQIADVEKALATTSDFWRRNELEVMLRNMRNQLAQAKVAQAAAQGLFIVGAAAAGEGPEAQRARELIEALIPPGKGPPILPGVPTPTLQHGGVVTRPTMALLGERGPEAVIPFSALDRLADRIAASIGGRSQPVVVMLDGRVIATVLGYRAERQEQVRS